MKAAVALALVACGSPPGDDVHLVDAAPADAPAQVTQVTATIDSTRFVTRDHMLASAEMQIGGEPFAEAMGRDLGGYSRDLLPPNLYNDPVLGTYWIDLAGYASGIETYEYSKQPMNFVAFESGAGTALAHAALVPDLAGSVQHFARGSNAHGKWVFAAGTYPANNPLGNVNPTGTGVPATNPLGWPGMWPTAHVFASFDPAIDPTNHVDLLCSISSDDTPQGGGRTLSADYECDASSLHLRDRSAQIDPAITPGADGFTAWKYGLWAINYLQVMHDDLEAPVDAVPAADLALVGTAGYPVHLGSSDIEGFQAQLLVLEADARADDWLLRLATSDGATLSGFPSIASAAAYDYGAPLRWFPGKIAVAEAPAGAFPVPSYSLAAAQPDALDLVGLALGYAELYALTDTANPDVGGSQATRAVFDGDPFPADDQIANGEATLHDRAAAIVRVAVIDLDRMHGGDASITALDAAYTIVGLRTVLRSLTSQLQLYSNNTPDAPLATALDATPIHYPGDAGLTFGARVRQMIRARADVLYDHLTDATGRAFSAYDGASTSGADELDAHTAAIRGLFAAYLATGDTRYRTRAVQIFQHLDAAFYDADARIYGAAPAPVASATYTPLRFGLLYGALRDMYELVASAPGGEQQALVLEARVARLVKLVLNGWDDRDRDQRVFVSECAGGPDGGGLQMAERTLTGETGRGGEGASGPPSADRDSDCVPEIDDAHVPAALAAAATFHVTRGPLAP